jgi:hypothetical protein
MNTERVDAMLAPLVGQEILGGCENCTAFQTVPAVTEGVWLLNVHHDDTCPTLARMQGRGGAS